MAAIALSRAGGADVSAAVPPPLAELAYPFLPSGEGRPGVVIAAPPTWAFDPRAVPADADVVIWGRLPSAGGGIRRALARERALRTLRPPAQLEVCAVHRLAAPGLAAGVRGDLRSALRGGALVEIARRDGVRRVLDAVADRADLARLGSRVHAGSGGTLLVRGTLVDGTGVLLRVGRCGTPADPAHVADELERLGAAAVPLVPRLLGRGSCAGASWVAELALAGRRPVRAGGELVRQVVAACTRFPRFEGAPAAVVDDVVGAAALLPERAARLLVLAADLATQARGLPAILRHGDLWTGNLLVDRGRLTGMIDWDAAHPAGVAGADLVQLLATEARRRAHRSLGAAFVARPWRAPAFRRATAQYWAAVGAAPHRELLEVAGIAWWATEVHHTLARLPHRAADERWVAANVDAVLVNLGY